MMQDASSKKHVLIVEHPTVNVNVNVSVNVNVNRMFCITISILFRQFLKEC